MEFHTDTDTNTDTDIRISFHTDTDTDIRFSIIPISKIHTDTDNFFWYRWDTITLPFSLLGRKDK